jgi:two-component system sensor histidine kinase TctE
MLRPVAEMAAAAAGVTASTSDRRLPIDNPDDELGRLGTRFNALLDRLDGALGAQRRFLGDAAHELRTPIARMRGRVEVARLAAPTDETLAQLDGDLRRTSQLVAELLELAQLDGRTMGHALEAGFLDDIVTDEWRAWSGEAQRAGVTLGMSAVEEAPVQLDRTLLPRLVGVLIDNALRYTPAGGRVDVRVTAQEGAALLEVEDDGPGIPAEDRVRLTERFFRGATARAARPEGSGLGLAIAQEIVDRHGASLTFRSGRDGRGTCACVRFPAFTADSSSRPTLGRDADIPVPSTPATPLVS